MPDEKGISDKAIAALRQDPGYAGDDPFKAQLEKDMADPTTGVAEAWIKNKWTLALLSKAVTSYANAKMRGVSGYQTSETVYGWMRHIVVENLKSADRAPDAPKAEGKEAEAKPQPKPKKEKPLSPYVQGSLFEEIEPK